MIKKEELHSLVHSLSKSEKRYFHLFCTREASGGNYLRLFDAIASQEDYDEAQIRRKFHSEKFLDQLHVTKNYMKRLILKSLRNFHAGISREAELKDIFRNLEILFNKELYQLCETELKRAEAIAGKYEILPGLIEAINWRRKLIQTLRPNNFGELKVLMDTQTVVLAYLQNTNAYWKLAADLSGKVMNTSVDSEDTRLQENPGLPLTLEAKILSYTCAYLQRIKDNQQELAQQELLNLIVLLEAHPQRIEEEPGMYVSTINNLVSYQIFTKKYEDAIRLLQKAKNVYEKWRITSENRTLLKQILRTYNIELELYRSTRIFLKEAAFIESTEAFVEKNVQKMPKEYLLSFWFQLASIHFMRNEFAKSLQWTNKILNARFTGIRPDLYIHANLLNLMIHFEQQNLMVLRYYVDSTKRFVKKVREIGFFEDTMLRFFTRLAKTPLLDQPKAFSELNHKLFYENVSKSEESDLKGYLDYRAWIEGRL